MLVNQDGTRDEKVNAFLLTNDRYYGVAENQFLQVTPTGKRLELWENLKDGRTLRVAYWHINSLIATYKETMRSTELLSINLQPQLASHHLA